MKSVWCFGLQQPQSGFFFVDNDPHPVRVHEVLINILHCMMLVHTICEFAIRIDV